MIITRPQPPVAAKPVLAQKPAPAKAAMTHEELCDLAAELKPTVTVTIPPRLNEWVFDVHRDKSGNIARINATGHAK